MFCVMPTRWASGTHSIAGDYWIARIREGFAELPRGDSLGEKIRRRPAMAERQVGQLSFADDLVADAGRPNATLRRLAELIDWSEPEALLSGLRSGRMGAPGYPALALFKALLLQQCYGLSDP